MIGVVIAVLVLVLVVWLIVMLVNSLPMLRIQGPLAPIVWILLLLLVLGAGWWFTLGGHGIHMHL